MENKHQKRGYHFQLEVQIASCSCLEEGTLSQSISNLERQLIVKILVARKPRLNTFHAVIDYQKKRVIYKIPKYPEFQFIGGNSIIEPAEFGACLPKRVLFYLSAIPIDIPVVYEFMNVFEDFLILQTYTVGQFAVYLIFYTTSISQAPY